MDVYVMVNGQNPQKEETLKTIDLKESSIERFRDCGIDKEKSVIWILARTGSKNAFGKSNNDLKSLESYIGKKDDTFDSTYEFIFFSIPVFKNIEHIKHYPIPNIKEVVERGVSDLEKGNINQQTKNFINQMESAMKRKSKNGIHIISVLDEN